MLRVIVAILFVPLGYFFGAYFAKRYKNRAVELSTCDNMLLKLTMYIEMQNMPTAEIVERLATSESLSRLQFLSECSERLKENRDFRLAWRESIYQKRTVMSLKQEDITLLLRLSEVVGVMDKEGICQAVALMRAELSQAIKDADEQSRTKGSLMIKLGVLMGILGGILFI